MDYLEIRDGKLSLSLSLNLGWGVTKRIYSIPLFSQFFKLIKILVTYGISLSYFADVDCGDICQIWMWFEYFNTYFCKFEIFLNGEINERGISTPPVSEQCLHE